MSSSSVLMRNVRHVLRRVPLSKRTIARFSTKAAVAQAEDDPIVSFQQLLEQRQSNEALRIFKSLSTPPSTALSQRLALLLAKKATLKDTKAALEVLKSVYMNPSLKPDDITKLAFIFVSDACYRNNMLKEALEVTEEAHNLGLRLDLPAYNNLINALVDANQTDEAMLILQDIAAGDIISPGEATYTGLIGALLEQREFAQVKEMISQARTSGVKFSSSAYMSFVALLNDVQDDSSVSTKLFEFIETCMEEDNVEDFDEFDDILDSLAEDDDEDDDDDDDEDHGGDDDDDETTHTN
ncbi:hypothetical protein LEN26_000511 [Aphanomyces euteiches]|uniref:Pentacotripeptide-repeat region of PRORP domain-containing protein n=1 Tax=Aphanomyces euteiches TaxID=100861 RepID=A0A6G0XVH4_9STRA|nr:hypothetical protein Ae201684_000963 [Aphanomyces euteiches]KAH9099937.1 hypothetical protein Ae201684P_018943 [Aphanomyces euteiches]KAH9115554.1 hypothetical protein AeMF1_010431 [Aphanomyces euteiches]KAH9151428.1 hypothetical protein AeRB84_005956 [Aphanomyces euteiches]KAH9163440.1 hypothetical protein LEN26_000511 [Aphanomyces euteiches]